MEHHANLVPWLMLAEERGIELRYLPITDDHTLDLSELDRLVDGVKLVALTAMSNVLGTLPPLDLVIAAAHAAGARVLIDAAQWVPHLPTDVQAWDADFVGFTGHKMLGPTGIGVLVAKEELLRGHAGLHGWWRDDPRRAPRRLDAERDPLEVRGGHAADRRGHRPARRHRRAHRSRHGRRSASTRSPSPATPSARSKSASATTSTIHGPSEPAMRGGVLSFGFRDVHPHDISQILDERGVCVRAGHHCAKPLMRRLGVGATARASLYVYNDEDDIDALVDALEATSTFFG